MKTLIAVLIEIGIFYVLYKHAVTPYVDTSLSTKHSGTFIGMTRGAGVDSVKAVIQSKILLPETKSSEQQFILVYKNVDGGVWKVDNALRFWHAGKEKDSIWVFYTEKKVSGRNEVTFLDMKPLKM